MELGFLRALARPAIFEAIPARMPGLKVAPIQQNKNLRYFPRFLGITVSGL